MRVKLFKSPKDAFSVLALVAALALVRYFEFAFYDPFREYFARDFFGIALPTFEGFRLFANFFLRYWLNTAISAAILYAIFRSVPQLIFAGLLYLGFFITLIIAFFAVAEFFPQSKMLLFYIRRFIIQPMLLLLFIPAFLYQNHSRQ